MEGQDFVIELLRELIRNSKGTQNIVIDKLIKTKMDEGPKRVRPPSREELLIELRLLGKKLAETQAEFMRLNPSKQQEIQRHKDIQVDIKSFPQDDKNSDYGDETAFLEDFDLSRMESMVGPVHQGPQSKFNDLDKKQERERNQQIEKLKFMIDQEKQRLKSLEQLVKTKTNSMEQLLNIEGDIEQLRSNLEKERSVIGVLEEKNQGVSQKLGLYKKSMDNTVGLEYF